MDEQKLDLDLDDIMREFSAEDGEPVTDALEDLIAETEDSADDTVRLDTTEVLRSVTNIIEPEQSSEPAPETPEQTEAFSKDWEPEYEEPIAEYEPPQPITFQPRSRLGELRRQLVEGPEHQYYKLLEKGVGKLQIAIFLSLLVVLASAAATALYAFGYVAEDRLRLMVFVQFLAMLISALLGSFQLIEGVSDLFKKKFTVNTYMVFTFIACCADGVLCLQQARIPCCAAFSLFVTMSLWRSYQERMIKLGRLDTMRRAAHLSSLSIRQDEQTQEAFFLRGEGEVSDFTNTDEDAVKPEKVLSVYALVALGVGIAAGVTAGVLHNDIGFGVQVCAVTLLAGLPATAFITLSRPMAVLVRKLHKVGAVFCGWQGIVGLCNKSQFPLTDTDFYPASAAKMNGVKFFGKYDPDDVVAYATALVVANGGRLVAPFNQLLDSRSGVHHNARMLQGYDGGIGGEVNGDAVLMGHAAFLRSKGVEIPEMVRVNQAIYVAINGEFSGLFVLSYEKMHSTVVGLSLLASSSNVQPVAATSDFMLTPAFLKKQLRARVKRILFPEYAKRKELGALQAEENAKNLALITGEGLAPFGYVLSGARSVKTASTLGVVVHMLGGIIGMVMMLVLAILGAKELLTPGNLFLYELVWMIPALMITEWTRHL